MDKVDCISVCYDEKLHQFKEKKASEVVIAIIDEKGCSKKVNLGFLANCYLEQKKKLAQLEENQKKFSNIIEAQQNVLDIFMQKYPEFAIQLQNLKLEKEIKK
jgi:hypothetical protein